MDYQPKILPNCPTHRAFQDEIQAALIERGFDIIQFTYHDLLPKDQATKLGRNNSLAALYIRTHTDLLGVSLGDKYSCLVEIKSSENVKFRNMSIEAYPFGINSILSKLCGIEIYYFWKDFIGCKEVGFSAGNHPRVDRIIIPEWRWNSEEVTSWKAVLGGLFEAVPITVTPTGRYGSGDPMVIIREEDLAGLPSPLELIDSLIKDLI